MQSNCCAKRRASLLIVGMGQLRHQPSYRAKLGSNIPSIRLRAGHLPGGSAHPGRLRHMPNGSVFERRSRKRSSLSRSLVRRAHGRRCRDLFRPRPRPGSLGIPNGRSGKGRLRSRTAIFGDLKDGLVAADAAPYWRAFGPEQPSLRSGGRAGPEGPRSGRSFPRRE